MYDIKNNRAAYEQITGHSRVESVSTDASGSWGSQVN